MGGLDSLLPVLAQLRAELVQVSDQLGEEAVAVVVHALAVSFVVGGPVHHAFLSFCCCLRGVVTLTVDATSSW